MQINLRQVIKKWRTIRMLKQIRCIKRFKIQKLSYKT